MAWEAATGTRDGAKRKGEQTGQFKTMRFSDLSSAPLLCHPVPAVHDVHSVSSDQYRLQRHQCENVHPVAHGREQGGAGVDRHIVRPLANCVHTHFSTGNEATAGSRGAVVQQIYRIDQRQSDVSQRANKAVSGDCDGPSPPNWYDVPVHSVRDAAVTQQSRHPISPLPSPRHNG